MSYTTIHVLSLAPLCAETGERPNFLWISVEDISPNFEFYNGQPVHTPALDRFAEDSYVFKNTYTTAPICAPSRSTAITGIESTATGTQHLRSEVLFPENIRILPEIMMDAGYYCTTSHKTDYNFDPEGRWHAIDDEAFWNRPEGKPFFSMINLAKTHEGHSNNYVEPLTQELQVRCDPSAIQLPPYVPDTPEFRAIYAQHFDLLQVMDNDFKSIIDELKRRGEYENTIIFFFGDHGLGILRGKRWLLESGLHVPFVFHVPEKWQHLFPAEKSALENTLVSFDDFAPTVLAVAGIEIPDEMTGVPFVRQPKTAVRKYAFGSRSRADDIYDISRSVFDGRYFYVRHFMPAVSYIPNSIIYSGVKRTFAELDRLRQAGDPLASSYYKTKPLEELYDMVADPFAMNNLALDSSYEEIKSELREVLIDHLVEINDLGFLNEAEMLRLAGDRSPFEYGRSEDYAMEKILDAALKCSAGKEIDRFLNDPDSSIRFWALTGCLFGMPGSDPDLVRIREILRCDTPINRILAAEYLCKSGVQTSESLEVLTLFLKTADDPYLKLQAAISLRRLGNRAKPVEAVVREELQQYMGDCMRRYRDWFASMFIGLALDQVLINCDPSHEPIVFSAIKE